MGKSVTKSLNGIAAKDQSDKKFSFMTEKFDRCGLSAPAPGLLYTCIWSFVFQTSSLKPLDKSKPNFYMEAN